MQTGTLEIIYKTQFVGACAKLQIGTMLYLDLHMSKKGDEQIKHSVVESIFFSTKVRLRMMQSLTVRALMSTTFIFMWLYLLLCEQNFRNEKCVISL